MNALSLRGGALGLALAGCAVAAAPVLAEHTAAPVAKPAGVGAVGLGERYDALRAAHLVGPLVAGCELAGPQARSARLRAPLTGSVELSDSAPRTVTAITLRGGAKARGIGVGADAAAVRRAFPKAAFDHRTDAVFGITLVHIPRGGGGRMQLALDTYSGEVTQIGIPAIPFCE